MPQFTPTGVIPACLLPFDTQLEIDQTAYHQHLGDLAAVEGVTAVTVNGHAAEVHALSFEEQQQALAMACEIIGDAVPIVCGISSSNCRTAARLAAMAAREGAQALLVFPNEVLALGGQQRPEMAFAHWDAIAAATDLPLILFQYPQATGLGYPLDTLLALCERYPTLVAIKDWCHDPPLHERQIRALHGLTRRVNVLTTHSAWLLPSLVLGCDGLLSGAGSVLAAEQVALWNAVQAGELAEAQAIHNRIYPTVAAFYREPLVDMHNRMKEANVLLGRLPAAHVRPPLVRLDRAEVNNLAAALRQSGLLVETPVTP